MIHLIMEIYLFIKKEVLYFVNMYKQNKDKKTSKLTRPKEPIGDRCIMSEREDYIQKIKYTEVGMIILLIRCFGMETE